MKLIKLQGSDSDISILAVCRGNGSASCSSIGCSGEEDQSVKSRKCKNASGGPS